MQNEKPVCPNSRQNSNGRTAASSGGKTAKIAKKWTKCPEKKKRRFQEQLMDLMTSRMSKTAGSSDMTRFYDGDYSDLSREDRVSRWQFIDIDTNGDGVSSCV